MKNNKRIPVINIHQHCYKNMKTLYKKANSKATRAIIGYMVKTGIADDCTWGGAVDIVREIERVGDVYFLVPTDRFSYESAVIAGDVLEGKYDSFAFSDREIKAILNQLENHKG